MTILGVLSQWKRHLVIGSAVGVVTMGSAWAQGGSEVLPQVRRKGEKQQGAAAGGAGKTAEGQPPATPFLPDWTPPQGDFFLSPVVGLNYSSDAGSKSSSLYIEGGIWGGLVGIPLAQGNPGVFVEPSAGYAIGQAIRKYEGLDADRGTYHRRWVGLDVPILIKFVKETVGVQWGKITGELDPSRQNLVLKSDSAVLLLPPLSAHFTHTYTRLYGDSFDEKMFSIWDNWLHMRVGTSVLSAFFDFGPGVETQRLFAQSKSGDEITFSGGTTYFKAVVGAELIPKLITAEGLARYTFSSDPIETLSGNLRLPTADLSSAGPSVGEPEDSFTMTLFAGYKLNRFVSLGYHYNLNVFNVSERDGADRESHESQGLGLHISGSF
jgi:hypothetical protein